MSILVVEVGVFVLEIKYLVRMYCFTIQMTKNACMARQYSVASQKTTFCFFLGKLLVKVSCAKRRRCVCYFLGRTDAIPKTYRLFFLRDLCFFLVLLCNQPWNNKQLIGEGGCFACIKQVKGIVVCISRDGMVLAGSTEMYEDRERGKKDAKIMTRNFLTSYRSYSTKLECMEGHMQ